MRLVDADYVISALSIFNDREHGSEHFIYGIETAKEIVGNAPTIGGWISAEDRLPDDGDKLPIEAKWVLVWLGVEPFQTYVPLPAKYNWVSRTWTVVGLSDDMNKRVKITHWTPLPEPPKEVQENGD